MMSLQQLQAWLDDALWVAGPGASTSRSFCRVHTDSRTIEPGDLFIALPGERFDANDFLAQAQQRGAVAAICQRQASSDVAARLQAASLPGWVVPDARRALALLATRWRAQFQLPVIAVTGSNGKTTVTQMIASILQAAKPQAFLATQGNYNNEIGVPLTVLRMRFEHEVAVLELGMNHPGEIARLAAIAQPTVALVNNAQREHLEFMVTVAAVAQENGAVIEALAGTGVAVFAADDPYAGVWERQAGQRAVLRFSAAPDASPEAQNKSDVVCTETRWMADAWQVSAHCAAGPLHYRLHIAGLHNVKNSLAAAACCLAAGLAPAAIAQGLSAFVPVAGRSRTLLLQAQGQPVTLIDDSYNANPDSVRAAIAVLAMAPGPRLLVLGDMGEVGDQGLQFHAEAGLSARELGIDALFTMGELCVAAASSFGAGRHFVDMPTLQTAVLAELPRVGSILVKGSRFMQMERLVQALASPPLADKDTGHAA
jgi:UDP-N-acetylmuramoyl-tripeptide--D-alanyl-D-alanine ligase